MHAFIHSFIQSTIFTLSLFHKNEPSITTAIHHNHPSIINHALHAPLRMAFLRARITLPWLAHNEIKCICMHTACQPPPYRDTYIHTYMHIDDDFLSPTECADEHLRWWWWCWYWPQSRYSSKVVAECGFMNDRPEGNDGHENMCDERSQNDLHTIHVHAKANKNRAKAGKISEIKTDRRSQETITVYRWR